MVTSAHRGSQLRTSGNPSLRRAPRRKGAADNPVWRQLATRVQPDRIAQADNETDEAQTPGPVIQLQSAGSGGGGTPSCSPPSDCPSNFCVPMSSRILAEASRDLAAPGLLAGIGAKVSPRVVGLWSDYLFGGSSTKPE